MKKGISLIVLVITIIVMIILAVSVVITLTNTGIINKANHAVSQTNEQQLQDLAALIWADSYMSGKRGNELKDEVLEQLKEYKTDYRILVTDNGVTVNDRKNIDWKMVREYDENGLITKVMLTDGIESYEIGSTVNYMPNGVGPTNYKSGWKLLGVDEQGRLLLMSASNITGAKLSGEEDFVNGIQKLNNLVAEYKDGTVGISSRSITVEDINKITGFTLEDANSTEYLAYRVAYDKQQGVEGTDEELLNKVLKTMGFSDISQASILDSGLVINMSWDGTRYPKCTYVKDGVTKTFSLQAEHNWSGFRYYDAKTNKFVTIPYAEKGEIATVTNKLYAYHGLAKYSEESNAYKMLFKYPNSEILAGYWLATHYTRVNAKAYFMGMHYVHSGFVGATYLIGSHSGIAEPTSSVRAVVTLAPDAELVESTNNIGTYNIIKD